MQGNNKTMLGTMIGFIAGLSHGENHPFHRPREKEFNLEKIRKQNELARISLNKSSKKKRR